MFDVARMFEMGMFVYVYLFIILLLAIEFWIRKKMKLGTINHTPALTVGWAANMVRTTLLIVALPLLRVEIWFVFVLMITTLAPAIISMFYYFKVIMFAAWIILVISKAFFEYKYLNMQSALITVIFAIPMIGLLYFIYTFTF